MSRSDFAAWVQAGRAPFFVATLVPLALGGAVAHAEGAWNLGRWFVVLIASFLVHLATNLANDYFDYETGADAGDSIGGSRVIQEGKIAPLKIRNAIIALYVTAFFLGAWIVWASGVWWLAWIMVFSFFSSLFYTAPPVRYGYHGLGELFVGINMGPVMVVGTVAAVTGHYSARALALSVPIGLMVALILYYQSLSDIEDDRSVGKITTAVRLGNPNAIWGYRLFIAASVVSMTLLATEGFVHPAALLFLVTLIPAYRIDRMIASTPNWKELHDRGGAVRMFYLANGMMLVVSVLVFG